MSVYAGDQPAAITWYSESRIGPELGGGAVGGQLVRTLEAYHSLGVAEGDELVGPDARVGLGVVDQTRVTMGLMRLAVDALDVTDAAAIAVRIHAELVFATRTADRRVVGLAITAINSPIIIAVIVDIAVSVEQKPIFAILVA